MKNPLFQKEKYVDQLMEELLELERNIKPMMARIDEIRDWCKQEGTFSTKNFVCAVKDVTRNQMSGIETVCTILGKTKDELFDIGLAKIIGYQTVCVTRREHET